MDWENERMKVDYEQTVKYFHVLADIRFKLIALVPVLTGAAIGLVSKSLSAEKGISPETATAISILGFVVTLGIMFYDQRNTQIYNDMMLRAKMLEAMLGFEHFDKPLDDSSAGEKKLFRLKTIWRLSYDLYVRMINLVEEKKRDLYKEQGYELLFRVGLGYRDALDDKVVSEELVERFRDKEISLSANSIVSVEIEGRKWLVTDKDRGRVYFVIADEKELSIYRKRQRGGTLLDRPKRSLNLFGFISMWHDRGLAMIYASAMGGWMYLLVDSGLRIEFVRKSLVIPEAIEVAVRFGIPFIVAIIMLFEMHRFDRATDESKALPEHARDLVYRKIRNA